MGAIRTGIARGLAYRHDFNRSIDRSMRATQMEIQAINHKQKKVKEEAEMMSLGDTSNKYDTARYQEFVKGQNKQWSDAIEKHGPNWRMNVEAVQEMNSISKGYLNNDILTSNNQVEVSRKAMTDDWKSGKISDDEYIRKKAGFDSYINQDPSVQQDAWSYKRDKNVDLMKEGSIIGSRAQTDITGKTYLEGGIYYNETSVSADRQMQLGQDIYNQNKDQINREFISNPNFQKQYGNPQMYAYKTHIEPFIKQGKQKQGQYIPRSGRGSRDKEIKFSSHDRDIAASYQAFRTSGVPSNKIVLTGRQSTKGNFVHGDKNTVTTSNPRMNLSVGGVNFFIPIDSDAKFNMIGDTRQTGKGMSKDEDGNIQWNVTNVDNPVDYDEWGVGQSQTIKFDENSEGRVDELGANRLGANSEDVLDALNNALQSNYSEPQKQVIRTKIEEITENKKNNRDNVKSYFTPNLDQNVILDMDIYSSVDANVYSATHKVVDNKFKISEPQHEGIQIEEQKEETTESTKYEQYRN